MTVTIPAYSASTVASPGGSAARGGWPYRPSLVRWLGSHRNGRLLAVALAASLLGACATPTPYLPAETSEDFGYRDQQLASDRFRVQFAANSATPRETVENYLLFRAAEVTLANKRRWFVITDRDVEPRTTYVGDGPVYSPSVHYGSGGGFGLGLGISTASPRTEYLAIAEIALHDARPADEPDAYEARDVMRHLRPTLARATKKKG